MLLVTEHDNNLALLKQMPPSLVNEVYIVAGQTPTLDNKPTLFGTPIHVVYVGSDLRAIESFVRGIKGDGDNVILVAPLLRWSMISQALKNVKGIIISNQFDTRESKIALVKLQTGLSTNQTKRALTILKYNFTSINANMDLLRKCAREKIPVDVALASLTKLSYSIILFRLCGDKRTTRQDFLRTLAHYRYAKKSIMDYLKKTLDAYIDYKLLGEEPPKEKKPIIDQMSKFVYLEDAMILRQILNKTKNLVDLVGGEV